MKKIGINFINKAVPTSIEENKAGKKVVAYKQGEEVAEDVFDNLMFAIGRNADTANLGLEKVGVKTEKNGKIIVQDNDKTDVDNIYALRDCVAGRLELTPTAILAGKLLARRLFNKQTREMSYKFVATTVFIPLEYETLDILRMMQERAEDGKVVGFHFLVLMLEKLLKNLE